MRNFRPILLRQLEAALAMFHQRIEACPEEYWDGKAGADTFRQVAYHALFWFDFYLSPSRADYTMNEFTEKGGDERRPVVSEGLGKDDLLHYIEYCHKRLGIVILSETQETLEADARFWDKAPFSRAELHLYNLRHIQHHTGQLSMYIRQISDEFGLQLKMQWVGTGWKETV